MASDRSVSLHVPRYALWLFGFLMLAPWLAFGAWLISTSGSRPVPSRAATEVAVPRATSASTASPDVTHSNPGPWGDLEYFRILIEPPEEFILADYTHIEMRPWTFKAYTEDALATLWKNAGLTKLQLDFVSASNHREVRADAIVIRPTNDFVLGLSPDARAKIYAALGEFPENFPQFNPYRLRTTLAEGWLDDADLPADAIALTKRLFYQRGTGTCFSDESVVLPTIPTAVQRVKYIKALSRKSAIVAELKVASGADVTPLVEYWGRGGRSKDLKPLLQSLARRPGGGSIDIVHLVPRFARLLAYTYPLPSDRPLDANHDCHWTSFNFQNDEPDEKFSDINYVRQVLLDQYYPVFGQPILGDLILFLRKDGVVLHSCVYIADDIVFTKNGPAFSIPWLFSSLADVQAFYSTTPGVEMRRYRAKNL